MSFKHRQDAAKKRQGPPMFLEKGYVHNPFLGKPGGPWRFLAVPGGVTNAQSG
jgi:hypothetical protein